MIAGGTEQQRIQAPAESLSAERIAHLEGLVSQARTAAAVFTQFTQEDVDRIVKPMVLAGVEQAQYLARLAIEETRLGVMEDKVIKNMVATEFTCDYVKDKRTVGVIREFPDCNLVEMAGHTLEDNAYLIHQVHAVALSTGICGAQEVRGDGGPAGPRWSYGSRKGEEPDCRNGKIARSIGISAFDRGVGYLEGRI
jgi:hypothetical protein